jgi:hypothetical protein
MRLSARLKFLEQRDQVPQAAAEAIQAPADENIELAARGVPHERVERGPAILGTAHAAIDVLGSRPAARIDSDIPNVIPSRQAPRAEAKAASRTRKTSTGRCQTLQLHLCGRAHCEATIMGVHTPHRQTASTSTTSPAIAMDMKRRTGFGIVAGTTSNPTCRETAYEHRGTPAWEQRKEAVRDAWDRVAGNRPVGAR